jgi:hypothetical protein
MAWAERAGERVSQSAALYPRPRRIEGFDMLKRRRRKEEAQKRQFLERQQLVHF